MARHVQLAPASLALVLSRPEAREAAAGEPGGRAVFRAFRRANARCFWNAQLALAASRLAFLGWLRHGVLLVRAPHPCLQVLRDAWRRRALRPPRGFCISALGDVFPVQMNPIAQSWFVPLAEVLCCAVSDMNAAQMAATQESLLEHLVKNYPGIAIPSQDILYTTLGTLIKERKIYHTGEGYFIVTPQTYFITDTHTPENKRALLSEEGGLVSTSVTYLVSVESCAELAREDITPVSHCPSCQCFPDTSTQDIEDPPTTAEVTRKGQKSLGEPTPLSQNQAVSASEDTHISASPKPLPYTKDKEKGRKFGFSFLWRSISRKEKAKIEHRSFSAQFPPEEWPVRDEDNLDNIPRDVEHEIIKRINPVLTVDNLIKHTVLMQKCEEQKKYNSQGTSTVVLTARPRRKYPSKEGVKKRQGRSAKTCRRGHSHRDRHRAQSRMSEHRPGSVGLEKQPKALIAQLAPRFKSPNEGETQQLSVENPAMLGSHLIYKKRISNPFQGLSLRGNPVSKEYNVQKTWDLKPSHTRSEEKPFQRSRSSDPSRVFDGNAQQQYAEQCHDKLKAESMYVKNSRVHHVSDNIRDGHVNYPPCSVLPSGTQGCSFRESMLRYDVYDEADNAIPEVLRKRHPHFDRLVETKETQQILPSQGSPSLDPASSAYRLVDKTMHQFQNLGLLDYPVRMNHLRPPESRESNSEELIRKSFAPEAEAVNLENEGLSDDGQDKLALYQIDMDDDRACSSLYLEDDDLSENDGFCQMLPGHTQFSFVGGDKWNHLGETDMTEISLSEYNSKADRFGPQVLTRNHCYKPAGLFANPGKGPNPNLSTKSCYLNPETTYDFNYAGEASVAKCVQSSAPAGGSLCDSFSEKKTNSEAELLQDSVGDPGKKSITWRESPPNQEMRKHFINKMELFNTSHMPVLAQELQREHSLLEGTENHSMAGDSGIDSPRTQSLASNNTAILDGLKRRQIFLQNFEGTKNSQTSKSLLQITPVINV
ncbi:storkhead-box protein 1 [Nannospalax galili]|uniref:Storkhead box 1 n=1 Tax=Nannospalax galili TaxID=1026970 RepID=A0A8C6RYV9_NANGA|nr:storkhead-box protein 1 [Nannospalax galili]